MDGCSTLARFGLNDYAGWIEDTVDAIVIGQHVDKDHGVFVYPGAVCHRGWGKVFCSELPSCVVGDTGKGIACLIGKRAASDGQIVAGVFTQHGGCAEAGLVIVQRYG